MRIVLVPMKAGQVNNGTIVMYRRKSAEAR